MGVGVLALGGGVWTGVGVGAFGMAMRDADVGMDNCCAERGEKKTKNCPRLNISRTRNTE